jgi:hypothetical protein
MTATTAASRVITDTEPPWCTGHYDLGPREAFHQRSFERRWGHYDERIGLGLTRFDHNGRPGAERIEIQYSGADEQGSVSLSDEEAFEFAGDFLSILAMKKSASGNRLALFVRLAYEAGRAFAAAVRCLRTSSPWTAPSQSRLIRSVKR